MKYIDAEKLIATLERQNVDKIVVAPLIRIIDSLQQEQPEGDFEKEVDKLWQEGVNGLFGFNDSAVDFARIRNIARHFYELGKNSK